MKTYCSKTWTDINIDFESRTLKHCCKAVTYDFPETLTTEFISNGPRIQERRAQSLQNIAHSDCASCWNDYAKGNSAYRDWANNWKDAFVESNRHILNDDRHVYYVEIKTDRTCDMSCLYCSSWSSSKVAQEQNEPYEDLTKENDYTVFKQWIRDFLNNKQSANNQAIFIFLGGEPTTSERFYELVDYIEECAETSHKNIRLEICTNANSKRFLMDKIIARMDTSKLSWGIGISNEGFGIDAELIRHGLSWERFTGNFVKYISHPKTELIVLSPAASIFSLKTFHLYIDWVHEQFRKYAPTKEFTWYGNFTSWPDELDIAHLPKDYVQYIDLAEKAINNSEGINFVRKQEFLDYLNQMRNRVGTSYNPDYKQAALAFLEKKQKYKKTDALLKLMDNLDL